MPAEQRGSAYRTSSGWGVRWWEHDGKRGHRSGFASKSAALAHFRDVVRPRLASASSVDPSTTLTAFIDIYLAAHALNIEPSTLTILRDRLNRAETTFECDSLHWPRCDGANSSERRNAWSLRGGE